MSDTTLQSAASAPVEDIAPATHLHTHVVIIQSLQAFRRRLAQRLARYGNARRGARISSAPDRERTASANRNRIMIGCGSCSAFHSPSPRFWLPRFGTSTAFAASSAFKQSSALARRTHAPRDGCRDRRLDSGVLRVGLRILHGPSNRHCLSAASRLRFKVRSARWVSPSFSGCKAAMNSLARRRLSNAADIEVSIRLGSRSATFPAQ